MNQNQCAHPTSVVIYSFLNFPRYEFYVCRCTSGCDQVFANVADRDNQITVASVITSIAPYCTGAPQHGYSYYWRWEGLSHSTPPIAPSPEQLSLLTEGGAA